MKPKNRIRKDASHKVVILQAPIEPQGGQQLKSSGIIAETEAALDELECAGNAASALVMMNAIQLDSESNEFSNGQLYLARHASREFKNCLAALAGPVAVSLSILRASKDGLAHPANPFDDEILLRPWRSIKNSLTRLSHLISVQDYAFGELGVYNSGGLSFTVCKRIDEAESAWNGIYVKLSKAAEVICSSTARPERMAA